jgi:hypothetical protein
MTLWALMFEAERLRPPRSAELSADFSGEIVGDFGVTRNGLDVARKRIAPQFVFFPLPFEVATELAKMAQQFSCFTKLRRCLFPRSTGHHGDHLPIDPQG